MVVLFHLRLSLLTPQPCQLAQPFLDEAKILREEYEETLAAWEKEQQLAHEEPTPPPRRSASQNAADFIAAATSGDGAPASSAAKSMSNGKAPAKRRRMGHYAGLGNIDEDTNTDTVCKACSMMFTTLEDKRAHLLSQHHRDTVGETEAAQPARDIALTIPIFTDEFVEHYERREKALRELRQESDQLVRNNSVMVEQVRLQISPCQFHSVICVNLTKICLQIEKLKTSVSEVRLATAKLNEDNAELLKDAEDLKNAISDAFRGIPLLPGQSRVQPVQLSGALELTCLPLARRVSCGPTSRRSLHRHISTFSGSCTRVRSRGGRLSSTGTFPSVDMDKMFLTVLADPLAA